MIGSSPRVERDGSRVRGVALLPGETLTCVFSPEQGLISEPLPRGRMLAATNQRLIAFCRNDGRDETFVTMVEELQSASIRPAPRRLASVFQGIVLAVAGILFYAVVAYWLTGRFDGPSAPVINIDIAPLALLLALLGAALLMGRHFWATEDGTVSFQGSDWRLEFPYRSGRAGREIYQVVNRLFAARQSGNGRHAFWED